MHNDFVEKQPEANSISCGKPLAHKTPPSWLNSFLLLFFHSLGRTKVYLVKIDSKISLCQVKMQPPPQEISMSLALLFYESAILH